MTMKDQTKLGLDEIHATGVDLARVPTLSDSTFLRLMQRIDDLEACWTHAASHDFLGHPTSYASTARKQLAALRQEAAQ